MLAKKGTRIWALIGIIGVGCKGPRIGVRVGYLHFPVTGVENVSCVHDTIASHAYMNDYAMMMMMIIPV